MSSSPRASSGLGGTAALLALLYLLPLRDVLLVSHNPALRPFDLAALVVLGIGAWLVLGSRREALATGLVLAFCLFYAALCLSAVAGLGRGGDRFLIARTLAWSLYCFGVFAAGAVLARRHEPAFVLRHLVWSLVGASALAYALFLLRPELVGSWAGGMDLSKFGVVGLRRFPGFASEPNFWGSMLLFLLPLAWAGLLAAPLRRRLGLGVLPLVGLLLAAVATLSTLTHAAVVASLFGAVLLGGAVRRPRLVAGTAAACLVVALVALLASGYGEHLATKLSRLDAGSTAERLHAALAALRMWAASPLVGHGLGTYAVYHPLYADMDLPPMESAHSVVMATLAEQGLLGLVALLALLAALVGLGEGAVRRALGRDPLPRMLLLGLLLYAAYFITNGNMFLYYFWFYCGLFHGIVRRAVPSPTPPARSPVAAPRAQPA
ncbi:MAG TPA: O-antigen ligase family protein [Geminicoccaceae bacterium]|nr:O-antigen ligase family protein [Geminicoccaceae bacterium]